MSTPKPGQIRCPTCHESTPPGAFCTRCGQPIPASARTRPRGLDRDELEGRLRGRRPTDSPYRRGSFVGDPDAGFDQFEPQPEDALAVRREPTAERPAPRQDHFDDAAPRAETPFGTSPAAAAGAASAPVEPAEAAPARRWPREAPHRTEEPRDTEPRPYGESLNQPAPSYEPPARHDDRDAAPASVPPPAYPPPEPDEEPYYDYGTDYDYEQPYYTEERRGGGPWLIVGIIGLGLVALLGGVLLSGLFGGGPGVARDTPSPTAASTPSSTTGPDQTASPVPTTEASAGPPGTFADGFTATVQPCGSADMNPDGCVQDGRTVSGDTVWVWAGFKKGTGSDVVGVTLVDPATDEEIQDASLELSDINCAKICNGYINFKFSGLSAGDYVLRVTRNGTFAAEAPFTVT
jgi:hypothetical protein